MPPLSDVGASVVSVSPTVFLPFGAVAFLQTLFLGAGGEILQRFVKKVIRCRSLAVEMIYTNLQSVCRIKYPPHPLRGTYKVYGIRMGELY